MNASLKIIRIGNSAGVVLPMALLAKRRAGVGDTLNVSETPDGIRMTAADPTFAAKMAPAEQIMCEDRISRAYLPSNMAQITKSVWIEADLGPAIHDRQLAEHGGPVGVRDASALESALVLARDHPFTDCNKRTAWVLARMFLALNNEQSGFAPEDAIRMVLALASGSLTEA